MEKIYLNKIVKITMISSPPMVLRVIDTLSPERAMEVPVLKLEAKDGLLYVLKGFVKNYRYVNKMLNSSLKGKDIVSVFVYPSTKVKEIIQKKKRQIVFISGCSFLK